VDGNVTLGKMNYRRAACFYRLFIQYYVIMPAIVHTEAHILLHKGNEKWNTSWLQTLLVLISTLGSEPHEMNFTVLLTLYKKYKNTLKTTDNVEHSQSRSNCQSLILSD